MRIFFVLWMFFILLFPYIVSAIIATIIIGIIKTKAIKSKIVKTLIVLSIVFFICFILINIKKEKPNDLYLKMNEINVEQSLIGLSKEEVVSFLGEPEEKENEDENTIFTYNAGSIGKGLFFFNEAILFDCYYAYDFEVVFNENNQVESTNMRCIP